jgi:NCS1 family nucleobase:cation symporter-1
MGDKVDIDNGQVFLDKETKVNDYLWNPDFNPVPKDLRKWGASSFASLWFAMAVIVPTWTLATIGLALGLDWTQVIVYMFLGNLIILIPTIIQSHGGARYGVAEPQLTRSRWGIYGAQIPSWIRSIISMGWWGIESFIIAEAATYIYLVTARASSLSSLVTEVGPGTLPKYFPLVFWSIFAIVIVAQLLIFYISPPVKGQKPLRIMAKVAAPIMVISFVIMFYLFMSAGKFDFTPITTYNKGGASLLVQFAFINSNVAYWATMAVSMPDYTKYAKSQFSQTMGQIPMPFIMMAVGAMALLGAGASISAGWLHVSSAAGFFNYDPLELMALYFPAYYSVPLLVAVIIGTFSVNVFANSIAPGYDIANTYPKRLTWFRGILIGVAISILLGAYTAYSTSVYTYVDGWLLAYGALLGMVEGIIVFDYAIMRHFKLNIKDLFQMKGVYTFFHGFNPAPIISGIIAVVVTYIYEWGISKAYIFQLFYDNSWITAFFIAGILDLILNVVWIIPKYAKSQTGSLKDGYVDPETSRLFDLKESAGPEATGKK